MCFVGPGPQHFHNEILSNGAGVIGDELQGCSKLLKNVSRFSSTECMLMFAKIIHSRVHLWSTLTLNLLITVAKTVTY